MPKTEEIRVILERLETHNFHAQVRWEYAVDNNGERTEERVVRDIFFINKAQIRIGRRFVSGFIYETDAMFNVNELRLPLSSMIGITNTGNSFPLAYCYISDHNRVSKVLRIRRPSTY